MGGSMPPMTLPETLHTSARSFLLIYFISERSGEPVPSRSRRKGKPPPRAGEASCPLRMPQRTAEVLIPQGSSSVALKEKAAPEATSHCIPEGLFRGSNRRPCPILASLGPGQYAFLRRTAGAIVLCLRERVDPQRLSRGWRQRDAEIPLPRAAPRKPMLRSLR